MLLPGGGHAERRGRPRFASIYASKRAVYEGICAIFYGKNASYDAVSANGIYEGTCTVHPCRVSCGAIYGDGCAIYAGSSAIYAGSAAIYGGSAAIYGGSAAIYGG
eukprot:2195254-Rhodomonas_salina.1